jgi:hypothetical protein
MTQYSHLIQEAREKEAAEIWGKKVALIHAFNTDNTTVWYEERPDDGRVIDTHYNDGRIERWLPERNETVWMGEIIQGKALLHRAMKAFSDMGRSLGGGR